jgi:demethylmacrocin O-methyltransferase
MIRKFLLNHFSRQQLTAFREKYGKTMAAIVRLIPFYGDLNILAMVFATDKSGHHYMQHYKKHFKKYRFKRIKLLEIGVGGYDNPLEGGSSLRMWKKYFSFGKIFSLDIFDKSALQEKRIKIYQGSQVDPEILSKIISENGAFDLIIDDGSHQNEHIIKSFQLLFPTLKDGGIYVIEDLQTSYWEEMGGDSNDFNNPATAMNFCKQLTDCLNFVEFDINDYQPSYYDLHIIEIHFYHNMAFIYKGMNTETSSMMEARRKSI